MPTSPGSSSTLVAGRRRGRPPVIDEGRLLAVAREVFLERGIRATTLEVAERAGISEGSLFHRFKTKEALFRRSMNLDPEEMTALFAEVLATIEPLPVRQALEVLSLRVLEIGRRAVPLMMMTWSNPEGCVAPRDLQPPPYHKLVRGVMGFLAGQIQRGTLRSLDPELMTRVLLGSLHHYAMVRVMSADDLNSPFELDEAAFVAGLVDLVLNGATTPLVTPASPP